MSSVSSSHTPTGGKARETSEFPAASTYLAFSRKSVTLRGRHCKARNSDVLSRFAARLGMVRGDGWHFRLCTERREGSRLVSNCSNWYLAPWLTGYKTNEIRIEIQGANSDNWKLTCYIHIKNIDERWSEFIHFNTCIRVCKTIACKITSLLHL